MLLARPSVERRDVVGAVKTPTVGGVNGLQADPLPRASVRLP